MDDDPGCEFCDIARGRDRSAKIVCDGGAWLAFFPDSPATPGHTLVIPRRHIQDFWDASGEDVPALALGALTVGRAIREVLDPDGINLITSSGSAAEQTVFHAHLHVVPRWKKDPIGKIWPPKVHMRETLKADLAGSLRTACAQGLGAPVPSDGDDDGTK